MTKVSLLPILSIVYSQHAYRHKNITSTRKAFNLSRITHYEWLRRFNQFSYLGLMDKERSKPKLTLWKPHGFARGVSTLFHYSHPILSKKLYFF